MEETEEQNKQEQNIWKREQKGTASLKGRECQTG